MSHLRVMTAMKMQAGTITRLQAVRQNTFRRAVQSFATQAVTDAPSTSGSTPTWEVRMLYDGECPLCMREVDMLRKRDAGVGKIDFVDIAAPDYRPEDNFGVTFEQAMEKIHAVLPDGKVVTDVEVFRLLYEAVGLGWVYAITKYEPAMKAANALYAVWAKYRLPLTGRPDLQVVLQEKKMCRATSAGADAGSRY